MELQLNKKQTISVNIGLIIILFAYLYILIENMVPLSSNLDIIIFFGILTFAAAFALALTQLRNMKNDYVPISTVFLVLAISAVYYAIIYYRLGILNGTKCVHNGFDSLYFSVITFTTVGYGDFVPYEDVGRGFAASEALFGYFTLGLILARIVVELQKKKKN